MSGFVHIVRCVGRAAVKNVGRALASLVPLGDAIYDIARDAYEEYQRDRVEAELRAELEALAQAAPAEARAAAEEVAAEVAADQPAEVRQAVALYLSQMPASIRRSLRRPSDPSGTTLPPGLTLRNPDDLLPFLPTSLPRFKPGDRPLAADWELVELLGKGGFGEVWKARHLHQSRKKPVALKFCLDPVAADSLRNEVALHDHLDRVREEAAGVGVVPLLDTFLRADPPCLMYELIEGGDLAGLIAEMRQDGRLTPLLAARLVRSLASVVASAHRLSPPIVHRDLKPSNVLVRRGQGELPELYVADFGIGGLMAQKALLEQATRRTARFQTLPTAIRGAYTPLYASPQQVDRKAPDPRDDIHALGVIWYQLVVGDLRLLTMPSDWREILEERQMDSQHIRLLGSCIASQVERRPLSAAVLAERLAALLEGGGQDPIPVGPAVAAKPAAGVEAGRKSPVSEPVRPPAGGRRPTVSAAGDGTHRSIGEAVSAASPGAEILVRPGVYRESVVLDRRVSLLGDGPAEKIVIESAEGPCLLMATDRATVRGLTLKAVAGAQNKKSFAVDIPQGSLQLEGCDITSDSLACVAIHGKDAAPTLRGCKVHDGKDVGVEVSDQAKGTIESCDIFGNLRSGVAIRTGAAPLLRSCTIHDGKEGGVVVHKEGKGTIESCDIFANAKAGVAISQGGDPVVRGCKVHDGLQGGVLVYDQGKGTIEGCDIFGNAKAALAIKQGGDPTVRGCTIHDGKEAGLYVHKQGKGTIEKCDIFANDKAGVLITSGGDPTLRGCKVHDNKWVPGVSVSEHGKGTIENCEITGNGLAGVMVRTGGDPVVRRCTITGNASHGIQVYDGGKGSIEGCDLRGNKRGAWDIAIRCVVQRKDNRE